MVKGRVFYKTATPGVNVNFVRGQGKANRSLEFNYSIFGQTQAS